MGAFTVSLDPAGYSYASEPGFYGKWTGAELLRKFEAGFEGPHSQYYAPPGSDWLLLRPLQFSADWQIEPSGGFLPNATHRLTEYVFGAGINPVEFDLNLKPGATGLVQNWWQCIQRTPDTVISLDTVDYSALAAAARATLPAGMGTVAFVSNIPHYAPTILPQALSDADYTPYLQWLGLPDPDFQVVFGFGNLACICTKEQIYVCISDDNSKTTWRFLGKVGWSGSHSLTNPKSYDRQVNTSLLGQSSFHGELRSLLVLPEGPDCLLIFPGGGDPVRMQVRDVESSLDAERLFQGGRWWIGLPPKKKLNWQLQCVAYERTVIDGGSTDDSEDPLFDLGVSYKPTADPEAALQYRFQWFQGIGTVSSVDGSGNTVVTATDGQEIKYRLEESTHSEWASDGTNHVGNFSLDNHAENKALGFLAPQVRGYQLRFPPVLTARTNSEKTLTDLEVHSWRAETSLTDPDGKSVEIVLRADATDILLGGGNWDYRGSYPVHIIEGGVVRVRAWVTEPDLEELYVEDAITRATALRAYKINAKALLSRADRGWVYLPQILNPAAEDEGYIEPSFVVSEVLKTAGFDTDDAAIYLAADDTAEQALKRLPGTCGATTGTTGEDDEGAWNPDYFETKLEYLKRLVRDFRGWRVYEALNGLIRYHPDPTYWYGFGGRSYYIAATIYRTTATAAAAGVPGQYMMGRPTRRMVAPQGNHITITGQGQDAEKFPHVTAQAPECWTDINDPNFTGEPEPVAYPSKLAVEKEKVAALAGIALILMKHRGRLWNVSVPLAPWQIGASGVVLGDVLALQGATRSDCWVHHLEVFQQKRDQYVTVLTVERLPRPSENTATAVGNCTGGTPFPGACLIA